MSEDLSHEVWREKGKASVACLRQRPVSLDGPCQVLGRHEALPRLAVIPSDKRHITGRSGEPLDKVLTVEYACLNNKDRHFVKRRNLRLEVLTCMPSPP